MLVGHTDDYVLIDEQGVSHAGTDDKLTYYTMIFKHSVSAKQTSTITTFSNAKDGATTPTSTHFEAMLHIPAAGDDKLLVRESVIRSFWVHSDDGWKEKQSRVLSSLVTLGGKVLQSS